MPLFIYIIIISLTSSPDWKWNLLVGAGVFCMEKWLKRHRKHLKIGKTGAEVLCSSCKGRMKPEKSDISSL